MARLLHQVHFHQPLPVESDDFVLGGGFTKGGTAAQQFESFNWEFTTSV